MVVTSGLPLLMVQGKFKNLRYMSMSELQTFIPFMTMCAIQRAGSTMAQNKPIWWSKKIPFQFPLAKPKEMTNFVYRQHLISVVNQCYAHHQQDYIISFSNNIASAPDSVKMVENRDGTTSLLYAKTMTHVLKFNNENKNYDSKPLPPVTSSSSAVPRSPRRSLLPPSRTQRVITDVYLCENCDAEFSNHGEMVSHERLCYGPSDSTVLPSEAESSEPDDLLQYLQLGKRPKPPPPPAWAHTRNLSLLKHPTTEFSSLLGQLLLKNLQKRDVVSKPEKLVSQYDSYCFMTQRCVKGRDNPHYDFRNVCKVTYRANKEPITKEYAFTKRQRWERYMTLRTGLDTNSRYLLSTCKKSSVRLKRCCPQSPQKVQVPRKEEEEIAEEIVKTEILPLPAMPSLVKHIASSSTSTAMEVEVIDLISSDEE